MELNSVYCMDNLELLKQLEDESVDLIYCDILYNTGKKFKDYDDKLGTPQQAIEWYRPRLIEMKRVLKKTGNIVLQCDYNLSHYLKVEMDIVFNSKNFKNEIIWVRTKAGKTIKNNMAKNTDSLIWYSKTSNNTFNLQYTEQLSEANLKTYNKDDGDGRGVYTTQPLIKPNNPTKGTLYDYVDNNGKVWKCPDKGWRIVENKMRTLENEGRLITSGKSLRQKFYLNERKTNGQALSNVWDDVSNISGQESVDYFSQKPKKLIERVIKSFSNEGDIVADFFCGSGTSMVVAKELNRKYIGCDINPRAVEITEQRLKEVDGADG